MIEIIGYIAQFIVYFLCFIYLVTIVTGWGNELFRWIFNSFRHVEQEMTFQCSDAFQEGFEAYQRGDDLDDHNPFDDEDAQHEMWREGWYRSADEDMDL